MIDINLASPVNVVLNDILYSGTAFGHVVLTGANCVVPSRVLDAIGDAAVVGSCHECVLVPNPQEARRGDTPYAVSYFVPAGYTPPEPEPEPEPEHYLSGLPLFASDYTKPETADAVKEYVLSMLEEEAFITVQSVVNHMKEGNLVADTKMICNLLDRLWRSKSSGVARYAYSLSADGTARNSAYTLNPLGLTYREVGDDA